MQMAPKDLAGEEENMGQASDVFTVVNGDVATLSPAALNDARTEDAGNNNHQKATTTGSSTGQQKVKDN
nr:unnamed protein product [Digitaria exilis]